MARKKATRNSAIAAFATKDPIVTVHAGLVKSDPAVTLSRTPFGPVGANGMPVERYYLKAAVPWKRNPAKRPDKIVELNNKFAEIAHSLKDKVSGIAVGSISGKDWKGREYTKVITAPRIAFEIAKAYGKEVNEYATAPSISKLMMTLTGISPESLAVLA